MIKRTLCFSNPTYLSLKNDQLVIKIPQVEKSNLTESLKQDLIRTIPIEDIGILLLDNSQITITHGLLEVMVSNNCAVITCDSSHMPIGLLLPLCGNTIQNKRFTEQIESSIPLKKQLWQQTIQCKIRNQAALLRDKRGSIVTNMFLWANDVKSGDTNNMEARAAVYYWKNMFSNDSLFTRDRDGSPPNNLLNYGYAILRAVIARSLVASGLLPTLGIHHHNKYNAYCLADDIMEPYRPYVDALVLQLVDSGADISEISADLKREMLSIPVIDVFINGQRSPLMVAAGLTTASLYKCFSGESRRLLYPEM